MFNNWNIGLFSGNDTRISGCLIGMKRDIRMRKSLLATLSSA